MATISRNELEGDAAPAVEPVRQPDDPFDGLGDFDIPPESVKGWNAARELRAIACGYEAMRRKLFTILHQPLSKKTTKDLKLMIQTAQEELARVYQL